MAAGLVTLILGFALGQPRVVAGAVRDAAGQPVEGAKVFVIVDRDSNVPFATGQSGADGAFALSLDGPKGLFTPTVLVYQPGFTLACAPAPEPPEAKLEVKLVPQTPITVRFAGPDGANLPDAQVTIESIRSSGLQAELPEELRALLAARTDAEGKVTLLALEPGERPRLAVHSKTFGTQVFFFPEKARFTSDLVLRCVPVGSLNGRVIAEDARAVGKLAIEVRSFPVRPAGEVVPGGHAKVWTDDQGKFHVPALVAGTAAIQIATNPSLPFRVADAEAPAIEPGKEARVEIKLERGVPIRGAVVEENGKPIAGVRVRVHNRNAQQDAITDAKGAFEVIAPTGNFWLAIVSVPEAYITPIMLPRQSSIPPNAPAVTLDTIRLRRSHALAGIVVDETDRPVPQAHVAASWMQQEGGYGMSRGSHSATNERGEFTLAGLPRDAQPMVSAWTGDRAVLEPVAAALGAPTPLRVRIVPEGVVTVAGRVIDEEGKPVNGATVRFFSLNRSTNGMVASSAVVSFRGSSDLTTDREGRFRTPETLRRYFAYNIAVKAPGLQPQQLDNVQLGGRESVHTLADIALRRQRIVRGTVVDRKGRPVPGATVFSFGWRKPVKSDESGSFTCADLGSRDLFVFAACAGYHVGGAFLEPKTDAVTIRLTDVGGPLAPRIKPVPRDLEKAERAKLLGPLLRAVLDQARAEKDSSSRTRALTYLVDVDPKGALAELRAAPAESANMEVIGKLYARLPEESLALIEASRNEPDRFWAYWHAARAATDRAKEKQLLSQALLAARGIAEPGIRAFSVATIAERLSELGEVQAGERLIREAGEFAGKIGKAELEGFGRGYVAARLAPIDLPAALKLIEGLKDPQEFDRHTANVAVSIAEIHPAEAERLLATVRGEYQRTDSARLVVARMAAADPDRARKIAAGIEDAGKRALAFGMMARQLADRDRPAARKLLEEAFGELASPKRQLQMDTYSWGNAAALLYLAESIAPEQLDGYFWKTLSVYAPLGEQHFSGERQLEEDRWIATLAAVLARYQPGWARQIFAPVVARIAAHSRSRNAYHAEPVFLTLALLEPQQAVDAYVAQLGEKETNEISRHMRPWPFAAAVLSATDEQLGPVTLERLFRLSLSSTPE